MNSGIEDLAMMGATNSGNVLMNRAAYCWVKHIESYYGNGADSMKACYRCEFRDSYFHECPNITPGGAGYRVGVTWYSSDCLLENNIMWNGNKVIVAQGMGGGNVIAYNYMDDAWGSTYPNSPEAGLNCGHSTTPRMALCEGNWTHKYQSDNYWGNEIDITVFRNWITGMRGARLWLEEWKSPSSGTPYKDYGGKTGRNCADIMSFSRHNFVGNVLGMQGQTLLPARPPSGLPNDYGDSAQTAFVYETLSDFPGTNVSMWAIGGQQIGGGIWSWVPDTYQAQLRQGNWDWVTQSQVWYRNPIGATGHPGDGSPQTIPDSMYLTAKPAFFGSNPWPWVDPTTGATHTLPAKARFDAGTPNDGSARSPPRKPAKR
jgi:hypothetical protein